MKSSSVLLLTSTKLKGSITSSNTNEEKERFFEINGFSASQKMFIETVMTEATNNNFTLKLQFSQ